MPKNDFIRCPVCGSNSAAQSSDSKTWICFICKAAGNDALYQALLTHIGNDGPSIWRFVEDECQAAGLTLSRQDAGTSSKGEGNLNIPKIATAFGLEVENEQGRMSPCPKCDTGTLKIIGTSESPGWRCNACGIGGNSIALAAILAHSSYRAL